jgi:hypothetical protein
VCQSLSVFLIFPFNPNPRSLAILFQTWSFAFLSKEAMVFNNTNSLWIKKEGHFFKVSELPNDGVKNIILSEAMLTYFKHAIVVISIENKTK